MKKQVQKYCAACGEPLPEGSHRGRKYCVEMCDHRLRPAPAVYRYVAPDGRCYVGSASDIRKRNDRGLDRSNSRIDEAITAYPAEAWTFEILKTLSPGCSKKQLHRAEQRYIDRFRSYLPECGFNVGAGTWLGNTPGTRAARAVSAERARESHRFWKERQQILARRAPRAAR